MYAALHNFEEICCELIRKGADPYLKDDVSHPLSCDLNFLQYQNSAMSSALFGGDQSLCRVMIREKVGSLSVFILTTNRIGTDDISS